MTLPLAYLAAALPVSLWAGWRSGELGFAWPVALVTAFVSGLLWPAVVVVELRRLVRRAGGVRG